VQNYAQQSQAAYGPLLNRLQGLSNTPLPENQASQINRLYDQYQRQLYGQYAAAQPGTDLATSTGPTGYRTAYENLLQRQAEETQNAQLNFQGNERQNILAQAGVTQEQLGTLQQLAQLDIDTIMARTQLSRDQAQQIKDLFGNIGSAIGQVGVMNAFRGP
jgi:hypothetical protein